MTRHDRTVRSASRRYVAPLAVVLAVSGCSTLLPSETIKTTQSWETFAAADETLGRIVPGKTTVEDLKGMGLDPLTSPNVRVLTYLDLMARLMPHGGFHRSDLVKEIQACLDVTDQCRAFEVIFDVRRSKRIGNAFLDVFGFKRTTHITGWSLRALLIVQGDVVVYEIRSGEPAIDRIERRIKPLGPLQELEGLPGMAARQAI